MKNIFKILSLTAVASSFLFAIGCGEKEKIDPRGEFHITSTPEESRILINDKEIGLTPKTIKLNAGVYILEVAKLNYKSSFEKISSTAQCKKNIEVQLDPVTASVMLISLPPGAKIEMDDKEVGETPMLLHDQTIGKHSARLSRPGSVTKELTWDVKDPRPMQMSCNLSSNIGTLVITSKPDGANIFIDGKSSGKTPFNDKIEQGDHKLKVEKSGYNPHEQNIVVTRDEKKELNVELQILPGSISVKTNPPGAELLINDKQYENTPVEIKSLQPGDYTVKVTHPGFDTQTRQVSVAPGQKCEVSFNLDSNMGGIDLVVNPPGVTIYLDGKKVGVSEKGEDKYTSKVFEIRNITSDEHLLKLAHKRALPSEKTLKVQVSKGKIERPKPQTMWIADTYLKLKEGREMKGKIRQENEEEIIFEPEPGIAQRYGRNEIITLRELKENE